MIRKTDTGITALIYTNKSKSISKKSMPFHLVNIN
jgi:hypothetical protein